MPDQPTSTRGKYIPTDTAGVYRRDARYVVRWYEDKITKWRSFPDYETAVAFKRDFVIPHAERRGLPPTMIAPGRRGNGWIYIFQSRGEGEHVKIGFSTDPASRLRDLLVGSPHELDLIMLVPGSRSLEKRLHEYVADYRLRGEWFSREALSSIAALLWSGLSPAREIVV